MGLQHAEDERLAEALDAVRQAAGDPTLPAPSPAAASPAAGSTAGPPGEQVHLFDHQGVPMSPVVDGHRRRKESTRML